MTKQELAQEYKISSGTLAKLLNEKYFDKLSLLGYEKNSQILPPVVLRKFYELYGEPDKEFDFKTE